MSEDRRSVRGRGWDVTWATEAGAVSGPPTRWAGVAPTDADFQFYAAAYRAEVSHLSGLASDPASDPGEVRETAGRVVLFFEGLKRAAAADPGVARFIGAFTLVGGVELAAEIKAAACVLPPAEFAAAMAAPRIREMIAHAVEWGPAARFDDGRPAPPPPPPVCRVCGGPASPPERIEGRPYVIQHPCADCIRRLAAEADA